MATPTHAEMLAGLIQAGALSIGSGNISIKSLQGNIKETNAVIVYMELQSIFSPLPEQYILDPQYIKELWEHTVDPKHKGYGHYVWICFLKKQKPSKGLLAEMKAAGVWSDSLEELPDNEFDAVPPTIH